MRIYQNYFFSVLMSLETTQNAGNFISTPPDLVDEGLQLHTFDNFSVTQTLPTHTIFEVSANK